MDKFIDKRASYFFYAVAIVLVVLACYQFRNGTLIMILIFGMAACCALLGYGFGTGFAHSHAFMYLFMGIVYICISLIKLWDVATIFNKNLEQETSEQIDKLPTNTL